MKFSETKLKGSFLIETDRFADDRGYFMRTWCRREFGQHGLNADLAQCAASFNKKRGTLRGMHFQVAPMAQPKLVRCTRGRLFDVIVDARPESPTYKQWIGVELSVDNGLMLYVPEGFAHGFITLEDSTEIFYQMSQFYSPEHERGLRYDDPKLGIQWPFQPEVIAPRDLSHPLL